LRPQNVNKLRKEHAASQSSHDKRRHELDLHLLEMEDLRRALSRQTDELHRVEEEKNRAASERGDMARTVTALEADLRRVKRDAEAFGRDLRQLRAQKDRLEAERREETAKAERAQKQAQAQIRVLKEEAKEQREKARVAQDEWKKHVCTL
jgi:chromosome segregation ATPase